MNIYINRKNSIQNEYQIYSKSIQSKIEDDEQLSKWTRMHHVLDSIEKIEDDETSKIYIYISNIK